MVWIFWVPYFILRFWDPISNSNSRFRGGNLALKIGFFFHYILFKVLFFKFKLINFKDGTLDMVIYGLVILVNSGHFLRNKLF